MTVAKLIKELEKMPKNRKVVLSADPEGNSFSELSAVAVSNFDGESVGLSELTPELEKEGYSEEDVLDGETVVVLWP